MTTVGQLASRARRMLMGSRREPFNTLKDAAPSGQAFFDLNESPVVKTGDHLGLGTEIAYVTGVDPSLNRVTVVRGVNDTPQPASHPVGTRVEASWRFFTADLVDYLADEIRSWPDGIFVVTSSGPISIPVSTRAVDLPLTRFRFPLDAVARRQGRTEWVPLPSRSYRIKTGLPTSEFPSGNALTLKGGWGGSSVILEYAQSFDLSALTDTATDVATVGLTDNQFDAAYYGVAWRAMAPEEANRSDDNSQPEPREAEEVEAGDALRSASAYKAIRDMRLEEEKRRLRHLYPLRVA